MSTLPAGHGDDPVEAAIERLIKIKCLDSELFELLQSETIELESSEDHNINNLVSRLVQLLEAQQSSIAELRAENEGLKTKLGQADTQQQELSDLYEVAQVLATRLDRSELITILEQKTKSLLNADTCSLMIRVPDKSELQILGPGHQLARQVSIPEHIDLCEIEAARVATTGESCFIENVPNCEYCRYRDLNCSDNGTHHMLSVPMIFQNRLIGAVNAFRINKPPFNKSDERKLSIIASAAAGAIENAEAYRRESETADKLQRGIKPGSGFKIPNFLVGCDYIPCVTGTIVGGDFYDVINLDDNNVAVVIADVAGKGIDAAIQAATARFTIRGLLLAGLSPAKTLEKLNRTLYELLPDEVFITLFCGILNTATGEMTYANAGHDFPVVFCHDLRSCTICELTGYALGMVPDANYTEHRIKLKPDDIAVLYTDGITEARHEGRFFGIEGLQETITRNSVMYPNDLVRTIFEEVFSFSSGDLRDDAGLLIIKALPSLSD